MKRIHILLSNADSLIMRFLKYFTGSEYNHASIDIKGDMKCFYTFGRRLRYFPVIGGFKTEEINMGVYSYLKNVTCAVYALDISEEAYEKLGIIIVDYVKDMKKYKYNLGAIAGFYINVPVYMKNRYTCSEFIAVLLSKSGICSFDKEHPLIIPANLEDIPGLKLLYKGPMKDICGRNLI